MQLAVNDVNGVNEGKFGGIVVHFSGGGVHLRADPEVGQQQAKEVLANQVRQLAPQNQFSFRQTIFEFTQGRLNGPASGVQTSQLLGWRFGRIENTRDQPIQLRVPLDVILDDPNTNAVSLRTPILVRLVDHALEGTILVYSQPWQTDVLLDTPKQSRVGSKCLFPQRIAEKVPVREAKHSPPQLPDHSSGQGELSGPQCIHHSPTQYTHASV